MTEQHLQDEAALQKAGMVFDDFKDEETGYVSAANLLEIMRCCDENPTMEEFEEVKQKLHVDDDGVLNYDQFLPFYLELRKSQPQDAKLKDLKAAFSLFDRDNTGYLSKYDVREILRDKGKEGFTEEEMDDIFQELDVDEHYRISIDEWCEHLLKKEDFR